MGLPYGHVSHLFRTYDSLAHLGDERAWWSKIVHFMVARKQRQWERKGQGPHVGLSHTFSDLTFSFWDPLLKIPSISTSQ